MEALRALASAIKEHTLSHLADYLEEFERNAKSNGAEVHWPRTRPSTIRSCSTSCVPTAQHAGESQIDADGRMRDAAFLGTAASRSWRPTSANASSSWMTSRRATSSFPPCTSFAATSRGFLADDWHRPGKQRRALPGRKSASAHAAVLPACRGGMTGANFGSPKPERCRLHQRRQCRS